MCIFVGKMASGNLYLFMCKCGASGVPSSGSEVERGLKARQTQDEGAQLLQNPLSGPATLDLGPHSLQAEYVCRKQGVRMPARQSTSLPRFPHV